MFAIILFTLIVVVIIGYLFISNKIKTDDALWHFRHGNVIVTGHKGKGKDVIFQWAINKRHDFYYSNISYGHKHKIINIKDVSCEPNTYDELINGNVIKQPHKFKEGKDIYISDGGNFLPSNMDSLLHKKYPSFPLYYSLSRHLYNSNVHMNAQSIERLWKIVREQADYYIVAKRTYHLPFFLVVKALCYDKYESVKNGVLPLKVRALSKQSKIQYDLFRSQNGNITKCYFIVPKWTIKYDTRAFEKVLLKGKRKK